jgi:hypothetical protein
MKDNEKSMLLEVLGDTPELRIIDFLITNMHDKLYKNEIIKRIGSNRTTFFKAWKNLEKYDIVTPFKKVGRSTLFQLNLENKFVKWLLRLDMSLIEQSVQRMEVPKKVAIRS